MSTFFFSDIIVLLQTLAKVVDGWKKHESEKVAIINQLKIEQETAEQSQQRQQEVRIFFMLTDIIGNLGLFLHAFQIL